MPAWLNILLIVALFLVLILVHEFGHFLAAKGFGVFVREFSIGFGPKIFSLKRGETQYTLRAIPFGGFNALASVADVEGSLSPGTLVYVHEIQPKVADEIRIASKDPQAPSSWTSGKILWQHVLEPSRAFAIETAEGQQLEFTVAQQLKISSERYKTERIIPEPNRLLENKPIWQRVVVVICGPMMNFLLAAILVTAGTMAFGTNPIPVVATVETGSPAATAGLQPGDRIEAVNGHITKTWDDVTRIVGQQGEKPTLLTLQRDGKKIDVTVVPKYNPEVQRALIGITAVQTGVNPFQGVWLGAKEMTQITAMEAGGLWGIISGSIPGGISNLTGPVGMYTMVGKASSGQLGTPPVIGVTLLAALINISVGIVNLIPFPGLDGSQFLWLAYEAAFRRRPAFRLQTAIQGMGLAALQKSRAKAHSFRGEMKRLAFHLSN